MGLYFQLILVIVLGLGIVELLRRMNTWYRRKSKYIANSALLRFFSGFVYANSADSNEPDSHPRGSHGIRHSPLGVASQLQR